MNNSSQSVVKTALTVFACCLVALTALAWGISLVNREFFHRGFPFNTQLFDPATRFSDLTAYYPKIRNLSKGAEELIDTRLPFNYFPGALYVWAFLLLFPHPVVVLSIFIAAGALTGLAILRAALTRKPVAGRGRIDAVLAITALCSYPFLHAIDRGNLEGVVWLFSMLGIVFFVRERYGVSAVFLALAVCIKPFPALFFLLFLHRRRFREIAMAAALAMALSLLALKALGPTIAVAYRDVKWGFSQFADIYAGSFRSKEIGFDHSLLSCVKQVIRQFEGRAPDASLRPAMHTAYAVWIPVAGLIFIACIWVFRAKPVLNQIFAIVLMMVLLPPVSYDYTLTALYLPWGIFMVFLVRDVGGGAIRFSLRNCLTILIPCAIVMTPQSYLTLVGGGFGGQVKALTLVFLWFAVARLEMPCSLFQELPAGSAAERLAAPG